MGTHTATFVAGNTTTFAGNIAWTGTATGNISGIPGSVDWANGADKPAGFADGVDDAGVTSVTAGAGLSGGTITATGTVAVAPLGITSSMIANGAVGTAQVNTAQVQARVSGTCPAGTTIQTINLDGSVVRLPAADQPGFATTALDSGGDVGKYTSITIGPNGLGLISYYDETNGDLKVASCLNTACSAASYAVIDSAGIVGEYSSLTIGADGLGLISYYEKTNGDLKVAHCSDEACSTATAATIDNANDVGQYTSIAIGIDGFGLVSYYDVTNTSLKGA